MSKSSKVDLLQTGDLYMITWRNGQVHAGQIIEKRPLKHIRDAKKSTDSLSSLVAQDYEYYIHFPTFDRRLDEWVTLDRINTSETVSNTSFGPTADDHSSEKDLLKKRKRTESESLKNANNVDSKGEEKVAEIRLMEKENEEITKVKNIPRIAIGKYEVDTWYFSPYPEEYYGDDTMFICEYCLKYMKSFKTLVKHSANCCAHTPPGKEIYREKSISMFEVDGADHKIYCQNLCLLSKLFLDHKTLYYDVDPFMFYVLCEVDSCGCHIVGYFSKEKQSTENNLACILTFPQYQRKGYGKLLISISYEITKREGTTGSPEKPLSDLGKISYRSYWAYVIGKALDGAEDVTIQSIQKSTGIRYEDILSTLHSMNLLKAWKGQHLVSIKQSFLDAQKLQSKKIRLCDPECLTWQPEGKDGGSSEQKSSRR
jgi:histone acetyltransferase MYST1